MLFFISLAFLLTVPVTVSACEGECIVGITSALLTNYTRPVDLVMENIAKQISGMLPQHPSLESSLDYLRPITDAYENDAYTGMEKAIFPSYFHGKCLDNHGVEPDGCPNPDCPIVCGTPGSLVHFYSKLRYIAYNQTRHLLEDLSSPGSKTYEQVEQRVLSASNKDRRMLRMYQRAPPSGISSLLKKREEDTKTQLKRILGRIGPTLLDLCGGGSDGETNGLPYCSWERPMKNYILTFP